MSEPSEFLRAVENLNRASVRFVLIGVGGANYYARNAGEAFLTQDRDLFLPRDPENELRAWDICMAGGLELWCGPEPLDTPRDLWLAEQVVSRRALVRAKGSEGLLIDLTLVMGEFEFEPVWEARRTFMIRGIEIPVARLTQIVESKAHADRPKDRLFLATYAESLRLWMSDDSDPAGGG